MLAPLAALGAPLRWSVLLPLWEGALSAALRCLSTDPEVPEDRKDGLAVGGLRVSADKLVCYVFFYTD